ncbi:MAG: diguanylate cyclase [Magnetococcus sp. DMHC-1]
MAFGLKLSIRNMVLGLAMASVLFILLLSTVALLSNHRLVKYHEELVESAFPVSEAVRSVLEIVMRLKDRQHEMMNVISVAELMAITSRTPLEQRYDQERQRLEGILVRFPATRDNLAELDRNFIDLLKADSRLTEQRRQWLLLSARLKDGFHKLEREADKIVLMADALAGKTRLEEYRRIRRIRSLLEQETAETTWLPLVREQFKTTSAHVQNATANVRQGSLALVLLSRQLTMERRRDLLISIRANGIEQAMGTIRDALSRLKDQIDAGSELHPLTLELESSVLKIPSLLTEGENSLYQLLQASFVADDLLRDLRVQLNQAAVQVMLNVEQLSSPAGLLRGEIAADTQAVVTANRWMMLSISVLAPLTMTAAIFLFLRWLMQRTRRIVHSLQVCSEGNYSSRVPLEGTRDELDNIAVMVNSLAQTLQRLESSDQHALMSRLALNALLETSLTPLTLQDYLKTALQIILNIPWIKAWNNKAAIFLVDQETGVMQLTVSVGLSSEEVQICSQVKADHCLCGIVLAKGTMEFGNNKDARCLIRHPGVDDHSQYCMPILSRGKVLGVLTLQVDKAPSQDAEIEALLTSIVHSLAEVIERKRVEERLEHMAHHDLLTGLPNRSLYHEHLDRVLSRAARTRTIAAVMLLDLDRFKQVNDSLGHAAGDALLVEVTNRIQGTLRASDLLARFGGDEFAVVLEDVATIQNVTLVAEKILLCLGKPFDIQNTECSIGVSIGISLYPEHGEKAETLMSHADKAMYAVKTSGRNNFQFAHASHN